MKNLLTTTALVAIMSTAAFANTPPANTPADPTTSTAPAGATPPPADSMAAAAAAQAAADAAQATANAAAAQAEANLNELLGLLVGNSDLHTRIQELLNAGLDDVVAGEEFIAYVSDIEEVHINIDNLQQRINDEVAARNEAIAAGQTADAEARQEIIDDLAALRAEINEAGYVTTDALETVEETAAGALSLANYVFGALNTLNGTIGGISESVFTAITTADEAKTAAEAAQTTADANSGRLDTVEGRVTALENAEVDQTIEAGFHGATYYAEDISHEDAIIRNAESITAASSQANEARTTANKAAEDVAAIDTRVTAVEDKTAAIEGHDGSILIDTKNVEIFGEDRIEINGGELVIGADAKIIVGEDPVTGESVTSDIATEKYVDDKLTEVGGTLTTFIDGAETALTDFDTRITTNTDKIAENDIKYTDKTDRLFEATENNGKAIEQEILDRLAALTALENKLNEKVVELETAIAEADAREEAYEAKEAALTAQAAADAAQADVNQAKADIADLAERLSTLEGQWAVDQFITRTNEEVAEIARAEIKEALKNVSSYDDSGLKAEIATLRSLVVNATDSDTQRSDADITRLVHDVLSDRDNNKVIEDVATADAIDKLDDRVTANEEKLVEHDKRITSNTDRITALENKLNDFINSLKKEAPAAGGGSGGGSSDTKDDKRRDWETAMFHKMSQLLHKANGGPVYFTNKWGETIDLRGVQQIFNGDFILKQEYVDATQRHSRWYDVY